MPLTPRSVLKTGKYAKGVRKTQRDPWTVLNPKGNRLANFGTGGENTYVQPTRLEVRAAFKSGDAGGSPNSKFYDMKERLEINEAYTRSEIDDLREHLARVTGQKPNPTTGRSTSSIYNQSGGDLGVPSYGTMGSPLSKGQLLSALRSKAKTRKRNADWERSYEKKLKQVQNKDLAKKIARAKAIKKNRGR